MAKQQAATESTIKVAEHKIEEFAEDLGKLLANAKGKAEGWIGQKKYITDHLAGIRDTANGLLAQLGISSAPEPPRPAGGRPRTKAGAMATAASAIPPTVTAAGAKKARTMSAEARARISAAQKKRWAKLRRIQGK